MKKIVLIMSMIACILLTACDGDGSDAEKQSQISGVSEIVLYDAYDLKLSVKAIESSEGNRKSIILNMSNDQEQKITATLDEWTVNGTYRIGEHFNMFLDPLSDGKKVMEEMSTLVYTEEIDSIQALRFHLSIWDENYNIIDEQEIDVTFEENLVFALDYNNFLGAKVDEQILLDDERVQVTLLEWGRNPDNNYVETVVCIDNKSDETIPAMISGMNINGIFFDVSERVNFLAPGQKTYADASILISDVEDEEITSIWDIELMILTDESENTGSASYSGGAFYPLILAEKGEVEELFITGKPLESLDDVHISYVDQAVKEWSDGGGYYDWNLAVVNDSDENVEVAIIDVLIDGVPEDTWHDQMNDCTLYFAENEVGAHSSRNVSISLSCYEKLIERPELTFRFQIRSMAGGAVITTGEEVITIAPDQE